MNNKIILVTGGSRGIGREIALELAKSGYTVIANYNKSINKAQELQQIANDLNLKLEIFKADVSKRDEVKKMIDFILNKYKKIDVLINNAGISSFNMFTDITDSEWQNVINTNLYSAFCVTQVALPSMINQKKRMYYKHFLCMGFSWLIM